MYCLEKKITKLFYFDFHRCNETHSDIQSNKSKNVRIGSQNQMHIKVLCRYIIYQNYHLVVDQQKGVYKTCTDIKFSG
jgi:hypothetical protein